MKQSTLDKYDKVQKLLESGWRIEPACRSVKMSPTSFYKIKNASNGSVKVYESNKSITKKHKSKPMNGETPLGKICLIVTDASNLKKILNEVLS